MFESSCGEESSQVLKVWNWFHAQICNFHTRLLTSHCTTVTSFPYRVPIISQWYLMQIAQPCGYLIGPMIVFTNTAWHHTYCQRRSMWAMAVNSTIKKSYLHHQREVVMMVYWWSEFSCAFLLVDTPTDLDCVNQLIFMHESDILWLAVCYVCFLNVFN